MSKRIFGTDVEFKNKFINYIKKCKTWMKKQER